MFDKLLKRITSDGRLVGLAEQWSKPTIDHPEIVQRNPLHDIVLLTSKVARNEKGFWKKSQNIFQFLKSRVQAGSSPSLIYAELHLRQHEELLLTNPRPGQPMHVCKPNSVEMTSRVFAPLAKPALVEAANGSESAQAFYMDFRPLSLWLMPTWAVKHLERRVALFHSLINVQEIWRTSALLDGKPLKTNDHLTNNRVPLDEPNLLMRLGLKGTITYTFSSKFLLQLENSKLDSITPEQIQHLRELKEANFEIGDREILARIFTFWPTAQGTTGVMARKAFRYAIDYMLKVLVVTDFLGMHGVQAPQALLERLVSAEKSAWDLLKSRPLQNLVTLNRAFQEEFREIPPAQQSILFEQLVAAKDPIQSLREKLGRTQSKAETDVEKANSAQQADKSLAVSSFELGVNEILTSVLARENTKRVYELTRRFSALHRRGACTYDETARELLAGNDAEELLDGFYGRIRRDNKVDAPVSVKVEQRGPGNGKAASREQKEIQISYLILSGRCPFAEWLEEIDVATRDVIVGRLQRLQEGNAGDKKGLRRGLSGISELRFKIGACPRIYFKQTSPTSYEIISGGFKDSQDDDIARALRFWRARS